MTLRRLDTPNGRFYETPDGTFPSVTTVLSAIPVPELDAWREAVGIEEADRITKRAGFLGTAMHSFCEKHLKKEQYTLDLLEKHSYKSLIPHLDCIEPQLIEESLWSKKLRVAGTLDCLGKYKGRFGVIDFKSTSRLKYDGDFDSYWLQCAFYAVMVYERFGLLADNLFIIMQDLAAGECNVYEQKTKEWIPKLKEARDAYHYQPTFLSQSI